MVLVISTLATLHSNHWHTWHGSGHLNSCYTPQSSLTPPGMVLVFSTLATLHSHHWHPWHGSGHLNSCYTPQSSLTPPGMVLVISTLATLHSHHWHPLAWFWSSQLLLPSTVITDTPWHGSGHLNSCYTPQSSLTPPGMVLVISTLATLHSHHWHPLAWFCSCQLLLHSTVIIDTPWHGSVHVNSCYTPQSSGMTTLATLPLAWFWSSQLLLQWHLHSHHWHPLAWFWSSQLLLPSTHHHSHHWHPLAWFWSSQLLLPSTAPPHGHHLNSWLHSHHWHPQAATLMVLVISQLLLHSTVITSPDTPWHGSGHLTPQSSLTLLNSCYPPQSSLTPPGMVLVISTLATLHSHHWHPQATLHSHHWHPLGWFWSSQLLLHSTVIIDTPWHGSGHLNSCYTPQSSLTPPPGMVLVISTLAIDTTWHGSGHLSTVITDTPWHGSGHLNSCYTPQSSLTPPGTVITDIPWHGGQLLLHSTVLAWFWSSQLLLHSTVIIDTPWDGSVHVNSCYTPQSSLTPPPWFWSSHLHSHHWHPLAWFWSSQLLPSTVIWHGSGHLNSCYTPQSSLTPPGMVLVFSTLATLHSHHWHPWHGSGHLNSCYTPQSSLTPPGMVLVISTLATLHSHHWHPLAWFWSSQLLLPSTVITDTPWHGSGHLNSCYTPQSSLTPPGMVLVISTLATLHSHHWHPQAWFWSSQLLLHSTVITDTPRHGSGHLNSCYTPQSSLTPPGMVLVISTLATFHSHHWHPLAWFWSSQLLLHSTVIIDTPWHGSGHLNSCYTPQSSLTPPGMVLVISTLATLHSHHWHPLALFWSSQLLLHSTVIIDTPRHGSGHLNSCYPPQSSLTPPGMVLVISTLATLHSHHWHPLAWFWSSQLLLYSTVIIVTFRTFQHRCCQVRWRVHTSRPPCTWHLGLVTEMTATVTLETDRTMKVAYLAADT